MEEQKDVNNQQAVSELEEVYGEEDVCEQESMYEQENISSIRDKLEDLLVAAIAIQDQINDQTVPEGERYLLEIGWEERRQEHEEKVRFLENIIRQSEQYPPLQPK